MDINTILWYDSIVGSFVVEYKTSDLDRLEGLIISYKKEADLKKKQVLYLNLVEESLKLVKKIVASIYPLPVSISREDLVQVGAIGVLKAIGTYKVIEKGSFKTYVSKFIKGKILQYLRDKSNIVKPPRESSSDILKVREAIEEASGLSGSIPDLKQISQMTNLSVNKVEEIINGEMVKNIVSLDQKIYSPDGIETLLDVLQPQNEYNYEEKYENKKVLEYALSKLSSLERDIICKYYITGMTKKDIAEQIGISAMHVGRLIKRALNNMYNIITQED